MKRFIILIASLALTFLADAQPLTSNQTYRVTPEFPKYVTAHVEFRDAAGVRWPSFLYGRPLTNGIIRLDAAQPIASFTLNCNERPQKNGDQSRRVLGELLASTNSGGVVLQINTMGPLESAAQKDAPLSTTFAGHLGVAGKQLPVKATGTLRRHSGGKSDEKNESLMIDLHFQVNAGDLGLKTFEASAPIQVRAALTSYSEAAIAGAAIRRR